MVNASVNVSGPLTHAVYTGHCVREWQRTGRLPVVHVQFRRKGVTWCGQVVKAADYSDKGDFYLVDCPQLGQVWAEARHVRLCSGEHCTCEPVVTRDEKDAN